MVITDQVQTTLDQNEYNFPERIGLLVCVAIFLALATSKSYDSLRRLTLIYAASGGNMVSLHNYTYNTLDQRTMAQLDDGTKWNYQYDTLGQVTSAARQWSDNTPIAGQQYAYAYDNIGNRTSTTVNGRSSAYTANTVNQYTQRIVPGALDILGSALPQATVTVNNQASQRKNDYFYKALTIDNSSAPQFPEVNIVAVKNNYGGNGEDLISNQTGHHYLAKTPETFSYDTDGNLLSDGRWQYTWDGENRLIAIESISDAPTTSKKKLEFGYDDQGRRISKKVYTWNGSAYTLSNESRFLYDGWNLVAELNGSNAVQKNFVWGLDLSGNYQDAGGIGGLLAIKQGSTSYYPTCDGSGSVTTLIKANDQSIAAKYHYGAFGEPIQTFESGIENPFRYSTKYHDEETNFAYYGYRFYDASLGRWLSQDPLGESGGANLYGFVANNPINSIDPLGLDQFGDVDEEFIANTIWKFSAERFFSSNSNYWNLTPHEESSRAEMDSNLRRSDLGRRMSSGSTPMAFNACARLVSLHIDKAQQPEKFDRLLCQCSQGRFTDVWAELERTSYFENPDRVFLDAALFGFVAKSAAVVTKELVTVSHFTSSEGAAAIASSGVLRAGSYVTLPGEVAGLNTAGIEAALEIQAGRGAYYTTFQVPKSLLEIPANGVRTSGSKLQFQLRQSVAPGPFIPTP